MVGLWVSVLCLGFPCRDVYLLGSGVCRSLHRLGVYPNQNSLGTLPGGWGFGTLDFVLVPLPFGFSCGGLRAGLVSVTCRHDGFLGVLLMGLFHCIVWGFLGLHGFVRVYISFVCCAGILISLLSAF